MHDGMMKCRHGDLRAVAVPASGCLALHHPPILPAKVPSVTASSNYVIQLVT